ncbi:MAG: hypothetical protein EPN33_02410 [Acidobacteria bacterium]|nr:MAG: hypothetical protein EPN33_02410 [Acidobacteriota bacterium]
MKWRTAFLAAAVVMTMAACGGNGPSTPPPPPPPANNPVPVISSLSPASATVGAAAQTLTINGSNFMSASTVTYNGASHTATFVSASSLTISLSASDQSTAGSYPVVVTNPSPGGGASNSVAFKVLAPPPSASSLSPATVLVGSTPGTVTITGSNFDPKATVTFAGSAAANVSVVSATQITFATTAAELSTAAVEAVVITNPDGQTATINFTVDNPTPTITAVQPQPVFPCDAPKTLTVTGTNFLAGTTVTYNGESKTATVASATQLAIPLTLADVAKPGSYPVAVSLAGPGGGTATQNFVVSTPTGPTLSGQGSAGSLLTVSTLQTGSGSVSGTTVCTAQTDDTGFFKVTLDAPTAAPLDVSTAAGGTINFLGPTMQTLAAPAFDALFDSAAGNTTVSGIQVGMFSEFAYQLAVSDYIHGKDATLTAAHADATKLLNGFYHFSGATAIELIPPQGSDSASEMEAEQGVLNEGVQLAWKNPADLIGALALDIRDGVWNGRVNVSGEPALLATAGTSDYLDAAINWANSSAGMAALPNAPSAELVEGAAACSCTPAAIGFNQTSSGNLTHMAFGGHEYVFQVLQTTNTASPGIAVYDVTDPTAALAAPKVWKTNLSSFWGVAAILGATDHPQIFAFDGTDAGVTVLNAVTLATGNPATGNPVEFTGNLPFTNLQSPGISASTGGLWITSAIWDDCATGCQVELASTDGYTQFDPVSSKLSENAAFAVPKSQVLSESMGASLAQGIQVLGAKAPAPMLVAGNYDGVQLVDFEAQQSYFMPYTTLQGLIPEFPTPSLGGNGDTVDGNAVDSGYGVAVLTEENGTNNPIGFLNLDGITETAGSPNAFTPANPQAAGMQLGTVSMSLGQPAVDSTDHIVFAGGNGFMAGQLVPPSQWATTPGLSDWVFYLSKNSPSLNGFAGVQDPNGMIVFPSLGMGSAKSAGVVYAYMSGAAGGSSGLLQVDVTGLLAMPRQGASGDAAHEPQADPATTKDTTTGGLILQAVVF